MSEAVLRLAEYGKPRRAIGPHPHDVVFFTKEQIVVGAKLRCVGRRGTGTWTVKKIISRIDDGHKQAPVVRYLTDAVCLRLDGSREERTMGFGYLSYSAIWRIG